MAGLTFCAALLAIFASPSRVPSRFSYNSTQVLAQVGIPRLGVPTAPPITVTTKTTNNVESGSDCQWATPIPILSNLGYDFIDTFKRTLAARTYQFFGDIINKGQSSSCSNEPDFRVIYCEAVECSAPSSGSGLGLGYWASRFGNLRQKVVHEFQSVRKWSESYWCPGGSSGISMRYWLPPKAYRVPASRNGVGESADTRPDLTAPQTTITPSAAEHPGVSNSSSLASSVEEPSSTIIKGGPPESDSEVGVPLPTSTGGADETSSSGFQPQVASTSPHAPRWVAVAMVGGGLAGGVVSLVFNGVVLVYLVRRRRRKEARGWERESQKEREMEETRARARVDVLSFTPPTPRLGTTPELDRARTMLYYEPNDPSTFPTFPYPASDTGTNTRITSKRESAPSLSDSDDRFFTVFANWSFIAQEVE